MYHPRQVADTQQNFTSFVVGSETLNGNRELSETSNADLGVQKLHFSPEPKPGLCCHKHLWSHQWTYDGKKVYVKPGLLPHFS